MREQKHCQNGNYTIYRMALKLTETTGLNGLFFYATFDISLCEDSFGAFMPTISPVQYH